MKSTVFLISFLSYLISVAQAVPDYSTSAFGLSKDVAKVEEMTYAYSDSTHTFVPDQLVKRTFVKGFQTEFYNELMGNYSSKSISKYTYDTKNNIIKEEFTTTSSYGTINSTVEYYYKNGKLSQSINKDQYGSYTTSYEYDSKGNLSKSVRTDYKGFNDYITLYSDVKDTKNYVVKATYYTEGGVEASVTTDTYINGNLSKGNYSSTSFGGYDYTYRYDNYGNILKYYENDNLVEDCTYEYDSKSNWYAQKMLDYDVWFDGEIKKYTFRKITYTSGSTFGSTELDNNFIKKYPFNLPSTDIKSASNPGCEGDCAEGFGRYYYKDGGIYEGFFKNGYRHGPGIYTFPDGSIYTGNWNNGVKSGFAMYAWKSGAVFLGYYSEDKLNGKGVYMDENKVIKGGIFKDGQFNTTYDIIENGANSGCVSGDCNNGFGKYIYSNGDVFIGFHQNNTMQIGLYVYSNNDVYIGEFYNSLKQGFGIYSWANKNSYFGMYVNGTYHGLGSYYNNTDKNYDQVGEFRNGILYKDMKIK